MIILNHTMEGNSLNNQGVSPPNGITINGRPEQGLGFVTKRSVDEIGLTQFDLEQALPAVESAPMFGSVSELRAVLSPADSIAGFPEPTSKRLRASPGGNNVYRGAANESILSLSQRNLLDTIRASQTPTIDEIAQCIRRRQILLSNVSSMSTAEQLSRLLLENRYEQQRQAASANFGMFAQSFPVNRLSLDASLTRRLNGPSFQHVDQLDRLRFLQNELLLASTPFDRLITRRATDNRWLGIESSAMTRDRAMARAQQVADTLRSTGSQLQQLFSIGAAIQPMLPSGEAISFPGGTLSLQTTSTSPTQPVHRLPVLLAQPGDSLKLTKHQVFLRQQIEIFQAGEEDVTTHTRGRNKPIKVGQVGVRCVHCAHLPVWKRQKGSTYFPATILGLYQACQNMCSIHLQCGLCGEMPERVKAQFVELLEDKGISSGAGRQYWASCAATLGLVDTEDGICLSQQS